MGKTATVNLTDLSETTATISHFNAQPNPFTNELSISFEVLVDQDVNLRLYDTHGILVHTLFDGKAQANKRYELKVNTSQMNEGVYISRLGTLNQVKHQKVVLIR
ncbi:T9SS type A sorting domain-containing protein [Rhodocytophaga rosea]|uniref:T9SS type A sorting domain-containing protein n=1 Tax=Rhodocytophaga rosea TaxID=2704465 RepID=A0A6C0GN78_9BACT|nr:T9SS type A sorting domain-containing protein [Rhodocytophaga rosea]QHT69501.1 T9SS type A sorting domain-containing protein [Rhodocytophaga rosea]